MIADDKWFTAGSALHWVWERMFTRIGAAVLVVAWACISWYFGTRAGGGFTGFMPYIIAFPFLLLVLAVMLVICTLVGDAFTDWAARVIFRNKLRSNSHTHQAVYFVLSCLGLLIGAIIFGMGDPSLAPLIP